MDARTILRFQRERMLRWWHRRPDWVEQDAALQAEAAHWTQDASAMVGRLIGYFWAGHQHYRDRHGRLAYYPGLPSIYGARNDAIEGVTRLMPLWAAYAASPDPDAARAEAMLQALAQTLRNGTDPAHAGYWGDIGHRSTLICEAADVALALWLGRQQLWPRLSPPEQLQVVHWLGQAVGKRTADNNWHLFVATVDAVLVHLAPGHRFSSHALLARVQSFAVSDGCYTDGPKGAVDFYNAWGFHYSLYWLAEMGACAPDRALAEFCTWYQWLFTPDGLPLFGRSMCYRHAACVPLLLCAARAPDVVSPGVAKAALLANWRSFTTRGGVRAGRPTQGVFGEDVRWLDPYSGPASSLWGIRSLVAFLYTARRLDWSAVGSAPLPAADRSWHIHVKGLGGTLQADAACQGVTWLVFDDLAGDAASTLRPRTGRDRLREWIYGVASRPVNNLRKAGLSRFSSLLTEYR
jgi:hypothetical protein